MEMKKAQNNADLNADTSPILDELSIRYGFTGFNLSILSTS